MLTYKEIDKIGSRKTQAKIKCKNCGHTLLIPPHLDKVVCDWCRNYVFKDAKAEFEYRLKERIYKSKTNKN